MFYQLEVDETQALCGDWLSIEFNYPRNQGGDMFKSKRNQFISEVRVPSVQEN